MAAKKKTGKAGYDFLLTELKKNPKASYADLKAKADKKKIKVFPIVYGRVKLTLGLVPAKKRRKKAAKPAAGGARRGPGRPRKNPATDSSLGDIITRVRERERQQEQMQKVLLKIRELVDSIV